ncbi:MAG: hypothetical protein WHS46_07255 [Desulfosoma sp.]
MGKYPVYQSPELDAVEARLRGGEAFYGFLANDPRPLVTILSEDERTVKALGLTHQAIANRLRALTEAAKKAYGGPVVVDGIWRVELHDFRGRLPCPWGHPGLYPKTHIHLERLDTGESLQWTDLSLHLIEAHGFYQGTGSPYRLDPRKVASVCAVEPEENP